MTIWKLVKLNFGRSPAHFGELGIGIEETSERIRSDTLFSAWISAYARLFGKDAVEELLQRFLNQSPPVRMSSTFIYREDGERTIYYLPRPLKFPINYLEGNDLEFFKTYKKLNYLPLEIWHRWYQGEGFLGGDAEELIVETKGQSNGHLRQAGTFDYKKAFDIDKVPKIAVDRTTRATNLYYTGFVQFKCSQNDSGVKSLSGLYFLLNFSKEDEKLAAEWQAALQFLGEEGLGGERSSGAGRFQIEWLELPETWQKVVEFSEESAYHYLISLFWDNEASNLERLITKQSSYEIQERGGWLFESNIRRKMVRMFGEGSVFPELPQGKLVDVTPNGFNTHRIYRSGISLSLSIKLQNK